MDEPDGWGHTDPNNGLRYILDETERVAARLDETLGDRVDTLYVCMGIIPTGTRRIITEITDQTPQEHVTLFHASRVFTNAMACYLVLRRGLMAEGLTLLRSALESTAQAALLLREPKLAAEWAQGRRLTPAGVRKTLGGEPNFAPLYSLLSETAHPNAKSIYHHVVDVFDRGYAIFYGGSYRPKDVANLLAVLVDIVLIYLASFYERYADNLDIGAWPLMIATCSETNKNLREWANSLPDDTEGLANFLADQGSPEPMPPLPGIDADAMSRYREQLKTLPVHELLDEAKRRFRP